MSLENIETTEQVQAQYKATAAGFSEAARTYDQDEEGNFILAWMRERAAKVMEQAFPANARLIELGCGTGIEATRFAHAGRMLVLTDVSSAMLEQATAKVREAQPEALMSAHEIPASKVGELAAKYGQGTFDGAYSSFGPLNCEPDLRPVATGLATLVKPGGRLVFSVINRICPTEMAWFALHLEFKNAKRRLGGPIMARAVAGGELSVTTYYYSPSDFKRAFQPDFRVVSCRALPLLLPPPYLAHLVKRAPGFFRLIGRADDALAGLPLLGSLGDHFLIEMERV